jgi:chromosome segregation ATPase
MAMQEMTQGNGSTEVNRAIELSDDRLERVREGIRLTQELEHDRDMLKQRLSDTLQRCASLQAELGAIQVAQSRLQTELEDYRRERDLAVGRAAEMAAVLAAAATILTQQVEKSKAAAEGAAAARTEVG